MALVIQGDDVDTDVMYPGAYLNIEDPEQMAQYLFEGRPGSPRAAGRREDPGRRLELRHRLIAGARAAGDAGEREIAVSSAAASRGSSTQLRQPRPRDRGQKGRLVLEGRSTSARATPARVGSAPIPRTDA